MLPDGIERPPVRLVRNEPGRTLAWTRLDGCITSRDEQSMRIGLVIAAIERTPTAALASNFARPYNAHLPRTWAAP